MENLEKDLPGVNKITELANFFKEINTYLPKAGVIKCKLHDDLYYTPHFPGIAKKAIQGTPLEKITRMSDKKREKAQIEKNDIEKCLVALGLTKILSNKIGMGESYKLKGLRFFRLENQLHDFFCSSSTFLGIENKIEEEFGKHEYAHHWTYNDYKDGFANKSMLKVGELVEKTRYMCLEPEDFQRLLKNTLDGLQNIYLMFKEEGKDGAEHQISLSEHLITKNLYQEMVKTLSFLLEDKAIKAS